MYSELNTFSFMGMSNISNTFLSEKDLEAVEFNFLVKPTLEIPYGSQFSASDSEESGLLHDQKQQVEEKEEEIKEEKCENVAVSCLQLKMPSLGEFKVEDEDEDGIRTPTSLDQRIPLILPCPPAPRKPKSLPSTKRKSSACRQILLDLSNEVESLFPPALLADLGGKIKKVRKGNCTD